MLGVFSSARIKDEICKQVVMLADDAIVVVDEGLNVILFNREAEAIFGYTADEIRNTPFHMLTAPENRGTDAEIIEAFLKDGTFRRKLNEEGYIIKGLHKSGVEFHTQTTMMRVEQDKKTYLAFLMRDITEDKKNEAELLKLASTDPLTGALNRREFTALADREARRSKRYDRPLSIIMFDLDHFKVLNDSFGHAAGDIALQRFTTICCNALRNIDIFGRWGGEEFVALLPETSADGAAVIAERLRKLVSETEIDFKGDTLKYTVSIGIAQFKVSEHTLEGPLGRADAAVYDAKKAGRNNIAIYQD